MCQIATLRKIEKGRGFLFAFLKENIHLLGGKFKFSAQGSNLSPFVGNGTKNKIPSDIKPPLIHKFFSTGIKGCVKIKPNIPFISLKISASKSSRSNLHLQRLNYYSCGQTFIGTYCTYF